MSALQIVREALRPEASLTRLAELAEREPAFALKVLALVNSAAFGLGRKVSDLRQATSLLGLRGLRGVALSLALSDMAPTGRAGDTLMGNSLRRAVAGRLIAEKLGKRNLDEYFTAGLILDVGLLSGARENLDRVVEIARLPAAHRVMVERARGESDHAERGAEIVQAFLLPADMVEAVQRHHDHEPPKAELARLMWAAERVAAVWEGGDTVQVSTEAKRALLLSGLDSVLAEQVLAGVPGLVIEAGVAFQRELGEQKSVEGLLVDVNRSLLEMNQNYESMVRQLQTLLAEKELLSRELEAANENLARLAATDALTGLSNKRALEEALRRDVARAKRDGSWISVVMTDVDFFKRVNDSYGHLTGDGVLRTVGDLLGQRLRAGDLAARYGGEEFALLLPATDPAGAGVAAERVRKAIERTVLDGPDGPFSVTASFGVASMRGPDCDSAGKALIQRADEALYAAKRQGRNRVVAWHASGDERASA